jgi:hypothetical protein
LQWASAPEGSFTNLSLYTATEPADAVVLDDLSAQSPPPSSRFYRVRVVPDGSGDKR